MSSPSIQAHGPLRAPELRQVSNLAPKAQWAAARRLLSLSRRFGFDPLRMAFAISDIPRSVRTALRYKNLQTSAGSGGTQFPLRARSLNMCLGEHRESAGRLDPHYFHQDIWAARKIHQRQPASHVDIGSRIDGFISHLLCFTPVTVIDIRPKPMDVDGLTFVQDDATELGGFDDSSLQSLSCLHAIEHFGLGRYGDPVAPDAYWRAMKSLERVLAVDGRLYFGVPVGRERLEFNAHRVFAPATVLKVFSQLELTSFAAVDDAGQFWPEAAPDSVANSDYACGLFEFTKRSSH